MSLISQLNVYQKRPELSKVNHPYLVIKPEAIIAGIILDRPLGMLVLYYNNLAVDNKELVRRNQGFNARICP
jgi:hypothetical protein